MDARAISKANLPSRHVTEGPTRVPHRSYLYAIGLSANEAHQPIGVASCSLQHFTEAPGPDGAKEKHCYADI